MAKDATKDKAKKRGPGRPAKASAKSADAKIKKGPGRPPKAKVEGETKAKRGPGRPPKPASEKVATPKVKKGPGRPPKAKVEGEAKVKRGPGRPAKPKTEGEVKAKRGPGRPPKPASEKATVTKPKRGPGRPPKSSSGTPTLSKDISVYGRTFDLRNKVYRPEESSQKIVKMDYKGEKIEVELYSEFNISGFDKEEIKELYRLQHLGRKLDEKAALYLKMAKGWSYHAPVGGHDGIQIALGKTFRKQKDFLFPYYRDFLTNLAAGLTPVEIILNGLSKETDVAGGGRHMSNHFGKPEWNIQNVSSCTGNHSQQAAGMARAIKKYNGDEVVFYSGGESATAEGYFFEAIAAADFDKSPCVFVVQNNFFGISVPLDEVQVNMVVSDTFSGFSNLKIIECDGRDVFASFRAMQEAVEYAQSGAGPVLIHAECDRLGSHSNSDRHEGYRSEDEMNVMRRRDPLMQFRYHILDNKIMTLKELEEMEDAIKQQIFDAADEAEAQPDADANSWDQFIWPKEAYPKDGNSETPIPDGAEVVSYLEGINYALKQEFRKNPNTFLWGQDIGKGGVFNVVKGMPQEFGKERVFNAPIAENQIVGTANGFSRYRSDIRVVVEGAEFADYFWPAMEQYVELAHEYWRTKGKSVPNVTLRLASGGYIQGGIYHSQNIEGALSSIPGVRIVQPAFADDAIGLMRSCMRSEGPTMFLEPKFLYNFKPAFGPIPDDDFAVPFGKAKVRRDGTDVLVVTYGTAVHMSNFAAEELAKEGISTRILDLRSIAPWDKEAVIEHTKEVGRVLVVHEDNLTGGFGGEIASTIGQEAFDYLDAPVMRLGSKDCHVGFPKQYEDVILIQIPDVVKAIKEVVEY